MQHQAAVQSGECSPEQAYARLQQVWHRIIATPALHLQDRAEHCRPCERIGQGSCCQHCRTDALCSIMTVLQALAAIVHQTYTSNRACLNLWSRPAPLNTPLPISRGLTPPTIPWLLLDTPGISTTGLPGRLPHIPRDGSVPLMLIWLLVHSA